MTFQPAHKDTKNPPGQIYNRPESNIPRSKTIGGIIDRVMRSEAPTKPTRTFEEWWQGVDNTLLVTERTARIIWNAARGEDS